MFDEDFVGHDLVAEDLIGYVDPYVAQAQSEAAAMDLPFDLQNIIDDNPFVFGALGDGPLIGRTVRFPGGMISNLLGDAMDVGAGVGTVIGDAFGRVVIAFETDLGKYSYLGWVNASEIATVVVHGGSRTWKH
jgi:hypothetical protein